MTTTTDASVAGIRNAVSEAQSSLERREYLNGLAAADSALILFPTSPDLHFVKGRLLFETNQIDLARVSFERVVQLKSDYEGAWHNLGNTAFRQKKYQDALGFYRQEAQMHAAARPWHGMGGTYWTLGLADSARWAYERAIEADASYAPGYSSLSDWYESNGSFTEALAYAKDAYDRAPGVTDYQLKLGALQFRVGDFEEAIAILTPLVEQEPWNHTAEFTLGQALQRMGKTDEAVLHLQRAEQLREMQATIDRLRRTAREQSGNFQAQLAYADALRSARRTNEAIREYEVALSLRPNNLALRNNIATLYLESGDVERAFIGFNSVLERDSTYSDAWLNMALHYGRLGDRQRYTVAFQNAVRYGADNPRVQELRSRFETDQ
ncbi:MAG: tetratricopeptide repeat protein [Rhodothermales bacterium]|nr:tetratricopeptide repeat protein [Rhodothermales bacterium]